MPFRVKPHKIRLEETHTKKTSAGYYVNNHSCFLLQYHLVLVTKYRHSVIVGDLKETLICYTRLFFQEHDVTLCELNSDKDHIHFLFEARPDINLAHFIGQYKSCSSRYIRKLFSRQLAPYYWKPYFWSDAYFLVTVSERSRELVTQYIKNQGK